MIHELKIQSEYFEVVNNKTKTFEIRRTIVISKWETKYCYEK